MIKGSLLQEDIAVLKGFSCGSAGKEPACRRPGFDPWIGKIPWRREGLPTPVFWPGEFHGLCSPKGCKESDATERLSHSHTHFCIYKKTGARKKQFKVNLPKMDITVL